MDSLPGHPEKQSLWEERQEGWISLEHLKQLSGKRQAPQPALFFTERQGYLRKNSAWIAHFSVRDTQLYANLCLMAISLPQMERVHSKEKWQSDSPFPPKGVSTPWGETQCPTVFIDKDKVFWDVKTHVQLFFSEKETAHHQVNCSWLQLHPYKDSAERAQSFVGRNALARKKEDLQENKWQVLWLIQRNRASWGKKTGGQTSSLSKTASRRRHTGRIPLLQREGALWGESWYQQLIFQIPTKSSMKHALWLLPYLRQRKHTLRRNDQLGTIFLRKGHGDLRGENPNGRSSSSNWEQAVWGEKLDVQPPFAHRKTTVYKVKLSEAQLTFFNMQTVLTKKKFLMVDKSSQRGRLPSIS